MRNRCACRVSKYKLGLQLRRTSSRTNGAYAKGQDRYCFSLSLQFSIWTHIGPRGGVMKLPELEHSTRLFLSIALLWLPKDARQRRQPNVSEEKMGWHVVLLRRWAPSCDGRSTAVCVGSAYDGVRPQCRIINLLKQVFLPVWNMMEIWKTDERRSTSLSILVNRWGPAVVVHVASDGRIPRRYYKV